MPYIVFFFLIFDDLLSPISVAICTGLCGHPQEHRKIKVKMPSKENNSSSPSSYIGTNRCHGSRTRRAHPHLCGHLGRLDLVQGTMCCELMHVAATSHPEDSVSLYSSSPSGFQISLPPFHQHPLSLGRTGCQGMSDKVISFSAE